MPWFTPSGPATLPHSLQSNAAEISKLKINQSRIDWPPKRLRCDLTTEDTRLQPVRVEQKRRQLRRHRCSRAAPPLEYFRILSKEIFIISSGRPSLAIHTQDEAHHGAQVAGAAAQVEEGQAGTEVQGLHHLRVDTRSRQVDVSMAPRQVLKSAVTHVSH